MVEVMTRYSNNSNLTTSLSWVDSFGQAGDGGRWPTV